MTSLRLPVAALRRRLGLNVRPGRSPRNARPGFTSGPAVDGIAAATAGLVAALHCACHTLGPEAGLDLLAVVRDRFGPLVEGAVIADFTAAAFTKGTTP